MKEEKFAEKQQALRCPLFSIQWHLTTDCPNSCKHCYMERNDCILSLSKCKAIVDDFALLIRNWNCRGRILFTGGDPFLYPYFFELLSYTRERIPELTIGILGNPDLLTEELIQQLKTYNLYSYQVSIDGLEKTHDYFRYKGSFKITLEKLKLLKQAKIKTVVMTTISNANLEEIPKVVDLVVENRVDLFGFHRIVPIGRGKTMKNDLVSRADYRRLLSEIDEKCQSFGDCETTFGGGEPLWKLLHFEKGIMPRQKPGNEKLIWSGCSIGCSGISILEDGTVLACRRLSIPIGKLPDQTIRDVFLFSPELNKMREIEKLEKCKNCELLFYCRGCRAIAYALYGDYFKPDPQCWKE
ncbi:MAG: radical SAM protein [bacterium]